MEASLDGDNAIAIIGVSCKLPGCNDLDEFWDLLKNGRNAIRPIPEDRWNLKAYYDANPDAPGKTYITQAGFVDNPHAFDNLLFGISDIEAAKLDPQQKWAIECTFRAMENAGIPLEKVKGSDTGVFMGVVATDHNSLLNGDLTEIDAYHATAGEQSLVSARVSYTFNLLGPSVTVCTGCSSAMTSIHLGIQALTVGDCSMAVCGGANALMVPDLFVILSKARMASPTGQSQAFSALADGYVRAEGCAVIVLKKLSKALADNDNIWATIGTGINQDGHTVTPITAPSGAQQIRLIESVHNKYNIPPQDITYFEAHGTGTPKGDPTETKAIGEVIGKARSRNGLNPLFIGSVKTNIGHSEATAGVASLVKVLLMMKHESMPPSLFSDNLNPNIDFENWHLSVSTILAKWQVSDNMYCGINCFGYGGSNSYAIVKKWPEKTNIPLIQSRNKEIIVLSAPQKDQLEETKKCFFTEIESSPDISLSDLAYTMTSRRTQFRQRIAAIVSSLEEVKEKFVKPTISLAKKKDELHTVFVCNGMGTVWKGMCAKLLHSEPAFAECIKEIDSLLKKYISYSLVDFFLNSCDLMDTDVAQLAIFACQVALARLLQHWGITPDVVIGHSVGEVAAAHIANYLTLDQAVDVIYNRGTQLAKTYGGKMLVVGNFPVSKVQELLTEYKTRITIAALNSPVSCTLSGDAYYIDEIEKKLKTLDNDIFLKILNVTTAFHSHHVKPILEALKQNLSDLKKAATSDQRKIVSTVTGYYASEEDFVNPQYWCANVRQPVQFYKSLQQAVDKDKMNIVIEIGAMPALEKNVQETLGGTPYKHLATMRKKDEIESLQNMLCDAYKLGLDIKWDAYHNGSRHKLKCIPRLIMQNKQNYFEPERWQRRKNGLPVEDKHPFVSLKNKDALLFKVILDMDTTPFVFDHRVWNQIVPPGALYAEVAFAASMMTDIKCTKKDLCVSVHLHKKRIIQPNDKVQFDAKISNFDGNYIIDINEDSNTLALANVKIEPLSNNLEPIKIDEIEQRCTKFLTGSTLYNRLQIAHFTYGPSLSVVQRICASDTECVADLLLSSNVIQQSQFTHVHPTVLDGLMQSIASFDSISKADSMLPASIEGIRIHGSLERKMKVYLLLQQLNKRDAIFSGIICSKDGNVAITCNKIRLVSMSEQSVMKQVIFKEIWTDETQKFLQRENRPPNSKYLIITNESSVSSNLQNKIEMEFEQNVYIETSLETNSALQKRVRQFHDIEKEGGTVIFIWFDSDNHENHSELLYNKCRVLVDVLKQIRDIPNCNLSLYVITFNGKKLLTDSANQINLVDSSLWGFVRTVIHESPTCVTLIDLENKDAAFAELPKFVKRFMPNNSEWLIRGDRYLCSYAIQSLALGELATGRSNLCDRSCKVAINSTRSSTLCKLYKSYQTKDSGDSGETLQLFTAVMPSREQYPLTKTTLRNGIDIPDEFSANGHQVVTLNGTGGLKKNKLSEQVFLYPVPCQSVIEVPSECLTDTTSVPKHARYILPQLFLVQEIYNELSGQYSQAQVYILKESDSPYHEITFRVLPTLLQHNSVKQVSSLNQLNNPASKPLVIILLGVLQNPGVFSEQLGKLGSKAMIVAVEELVGSCTIARLRYEGLGNVVAIQQNKIFSPQYLKTKVPCMFKWLKRYKNFPSLNQHIDLLCLEAGSNDNNPIQNNSSVKATPHSLFREDAKYIVIGGLQGLGWDLVQYMAENNAGILACVSRSPPLDSKIQEIVKLEIRTGVKIIWAQCDISNYNKTSNMLQNVRDVKPAYPIKGIFHGAVVYADKVFHKLSKEDFFQATAPKIQGAWNLHLLTQSDPLDYFVLHSSIASVLGNAGQSNYSAANGFLDGLAIFRRNMNLPGQAISWGALKTGILERDKMTEEILKSAGWKVLEKETFKKCFEYTLLSNQVHGLFWDADNSTLSEALEIEKAINESYVQKDIKLGERSGEKLKKHLIPFVTPETNANSVSCVTPQDKLNALTNIVSSILGLQKSDIGIQLSLIELGINSMHAVILRNKVKKVLQVTITIEEILNPQTTVQSLAQGIELPEVEEAESTQNIEDKITQVSSVPTDESKRSKETTKISTPSNVIETQPKHISGGEQQMFKKRKAMGGPHNKMLELLRENWQNFLQWNSKWGYRKLRMKDVTIIDVQKRNGKVILTLRANSRSYQFYHKNEETVKYWQDLLKLKQKMDIFMNERMLWNDNPPENNAKKPNHVQHYRKLDKDSLFKQKDWKSQESVFSASGIEITNL